MSRLGVVVIGRNEGERLKRCLRSVVGAAEDVVYVDSGSTDDSVEFSRSLSVQVVMLELDQPFTAARARNAGFDRLKEASPDLDYVLFVDGDCEMIDGFITTAVTYLEEHDSCVLVTGRRIERHPEASIYNRMCDLEWNTPVGETTACGGESVMRVSTLDAAGGFNPAMIAGEEPELCVRLRKAGGVLHRIEVDMSLHDADMTRFGQWFKRAERAGHAYAEGMALHGGAPWRHNVNAVRSILFWTILVPGFVAACGVGAIFWPPLALGAIAGLGLYPVLWWRVRGHRLRRGDDRPIAAWYATFTVLSKWPAILGVGSYWIGRLRGRRRGLIEYK